MTTPQLLADFRADWLEFMRTRLKEMGVKVKKTATDAELSHAYWNARHRWIPHHPRKIFVAAEFSCPIERKPGLEALFDRFEKGEDVKIVGFGHFRIRQKLSRRGRNPQTGDSIEITARKVLTFKPSKGLKQRINSHTTA